MRPVRILTVRRAIDLMRVASGLCR
ncbi:putative leader peptide [Polymorphospora rubra]